MNAKIRYTLGKYHPRDSDVHEAKLDASGPGRKPEDKLDASGPANMNPGDHKDPAEEIRLKLEREEVEKNICLTLRRKP